MGIPPADRRGAAVAIRHELNQFAPGPGQEFRGLGAEVNFGHRHVEHRLRGRLILGGNESGGLASVPGVEAGLLAGVVVLGVEGAVGSAV